MNTLSIADYTTSVNFITDSAYRVTRWNPAVARRRTDALGGRGPYEDVEEEMEITISGSSALSKLTTLQKLFEKVERWARGEEIDPVWLRYEPEAASDVLRAVIVGPPDSGPMIELPENFPLTPNIGVIDPVILRFKRRGIWVNTTSVTVTTSSVAHPTIATVGGLTASPTSSPAQLKLNALSMADGISNGLLDSYILMTSAATTTEAGKKLLVANAAQTSSGAWTTASDTTAGAFGSNILRYTPASTGTTEISTSYVWLGTVSTSVRRWGFWATYRNNGDREFTLEPAILSDYEAVLLPRTYIEPEGGTPGPRTIYLGSVSIAPSDDLYFWPRAQAGDGSTTLDINAIVAMSLDNPETDRAVRVLDTTNLFGGPTIDTLTLVADHRTMTHLTPSASLYTSGGSETHHLEMMGEPAFYVNNAAVAICWLGTDIYDNKWIPTNGSGTALSNTFTVVQLPSRVTPE